MDIARPAVEDLRDPPSAAHKQVSRALAWGIAALFVVTAAAAGQSGMAPHVVLAHEEDVSSLRAYRWVHPPPGQAHDNKPAELGTATIRLAASGIPPQTVTSGDGQCTALFKENSVAPRAGESAIRVKILPYDAGSIAGVPPGRQFDSNAYRIEAAYAQSGAAVVLRAPITVNIRAATGGIEIVRYAGNGWKVIQATSYPLLVMVADTPNLGTFAVLKQ